jgi:hypothetical protein
MTWSLFILSALFGAILCESYHLLREEQPLDPT